MHSDRASEVTSVDADSFRQRKQRDESLCEAALAADPARRALYKPWTIDRISNRAKVALGDYLQSRRRMVIARNTVSALFANIDVLVTRCVMRMPAPAEAEPAAAARWGQIFRLVSGKE
jgi:Asp-tRNA(Asn)/Glu-tRNA(Gln) amidotransferase A subunit family amidase